MLPRISISSIANIACSSTSAMSASLALLCASQRGRSLPPYSNCSAFPRRNRCNRRRKKAVMTLRTIVAYAAAGFLVLSAYAPAYADDYTPSDLTAAQLIAKTEAAAGKLEAGAYVMETRAHRSSGDILTATRMHGKDLSVTTTAAGFTSSAGTVGGQTWRQDANGLVLMQSRFHADSDPNGQAWRHPEDPLNNVRVLGITTSDPKQYVMEA